MIDIGEVTKGFAPIWYGVGNDYQNYSIIFRALQNHNSWVGFGWLWESIESANRRTLEWGFSSW